MAERRGMSSGTQTRTQTLRERSAEATRRLREALHLGPDLNDGILLGTALAEYVAERSRSDPRMAQELRQRYDELIAQNGQHRPRAPRQSGAQPPLVPVGRAQPGERLTIDPFEPPDPAFLTRVYGHAQLGRALERYSVDMLKQTAVRIEQEHPGTKPTNRGQKKPLIDYIVKYST